LLPFHLVPAEKHIQLACRRNTRSRDLLIKHANYAINPSLIEKEEKDLKLFLNEFWGRIFFTKLSTIHKLSTKLLSIKRAKKITELSDTEFLKVCMKETMDAAIETF